MAGSAAPELDAEDEEGSSRVENRALESDWEPAARAARKDCSVDDVADDESDDDEVLPVDDVPDVGSRREAPPPA